MDKTKKILSTKPSLNFVEAEKARALKYILSKRYSPGLIDPSIASLNINININTILQRTSINAATRSRLKNIKNKLHISHAPNELIGTMINCKDKITSSSRTSVMRSQKPDKQRLHPLRTMDKSNAAGRTLHVENPRRKRSRIAKFSSMQMNQEKGRAESRSVKRTRERVSDLQREGTSVITIKKIGGDGVRKKMKHFALPKQGMELPDIEGLYQRTNLCLNIENVGAKEEAQREAKKVNTIKEPVERDLKRCIRLPLIKDASKPIKKIAIKIRLNNSSDISRWNDDYESDSSFL